MRWLLAAGLLGLVLACEEPLCGRGTGCKCTKNTNSTRIECAHSAAIARHTNYAPRGNCTGLEILIKSSEHLELPWRNFVGESPLSIRQLLVEAPLACSCVNLWLASAALDGNAISDVLDLEVNSTRPPVEMLTRHLFRLPKVDTADGLCPEMDTRMCGAPVISVDANGTSGRLRCSAPGHCLKARFRPFHPTLAAAVRLDEEEEGEKDCPSAVSLGLEGRSVADSGWLVCRVTDAPAPAAKLVPVLFSGPPVIHAISGPRTQNKVEMRSFRVSAHPPLASLHWRHNVSLAPAYVAEIELGPSRQFAVRRNVSAVDTWGSTTRVTALFGNPDMLCTGGRFSVAACNAAGCAVANFSVGGGQKNGRCRANPGLHPFVEVGPRRYYGVRPVQVPAKNEKSEAMTWLIVSLLLITMLVSALGLLVYCHCRLQRRPKPSLPSQAPPSCDSEGYQLAGWRRRADSADDCPLLKTTNETYYAWVDSFVEESGVRPIAASELRVVRPLGEGAFGKVFLVETKAKEEPTLNYSTILSSTASGETETRLGEELPEYVNEAPWPPLMAMKQLKWVTEEKVEDLKREAGVMMSLDHPNIVSFFGVTLSPSLALLYEFMEKGDLVSYLRNHNPDLVDLAKLGLEPLTLVHLLNISRQVACGLEYLASRRLVHRDLAARNCLVSSADTVKISDFGMSRDICITDYYKMGGHTVVPLRWLPPESIIYRKFTTASDVWSFGVLLWEVFSFGQIPWCQYSNDEVLGIVREGRRLGTPAGCPAEVEGRLLRGCWALNPSERLSAADARGLLDQLLEETKGYCSLSSVGITELSRDQSQNSLAGASGL